MITFVEELANELGQVSQDHLHQLRTIAFVLTLADTGLRVHEVCKMRRGDLDTKTLKAVVIGKGDKQALVRFSSRSAEAIQAYLKSRQGIDEASGKRLDNIPIFVGHDGGGLKYQNPMSTNTGRVIIAEVSESLFGEEVKGQVTPHSFRHYFVTKAMNRSGGNLRVAQELARHSDLSTTERYVHLTDAELDEHYAEIFQDG